MGRRKYPPLTPSEVKEILLALGFKWKRTEGSHSHYERAADHILTRKIATVDNGYPQFDESLLKRIIENSGFSRDQFYGASKKTAKKANVKLYVPPAPEGSIA